jgi:hypothetical protein
MPTINQLPVAQTVAPSDEVLVSQAGATRSVPVGSLLASSQPAIMAPTGSLLGRMSLGAGGPEPIGVGTGLAVVDASLEANGSDHASFPVKASLTPTDQAVLNSNGTPALLELSILRGLFSAGENVTIDSSGVISATGTVTAGGPASGSSSSIAGLTQVDALVGSDLVAVSQSGVDHSISYANLIDGETIDNGAVAGAAADTDTFWVGQGSSTMLVQTFAAMWSWIAGHLPGYRQPVVELTVNTTLDGSVHNGAILVISKPITLTHSATEGSGFACKLVNVSGGVVTLDSSITTTSGLQTVANGQCAELYALTYSGGSLNIGWVSGPSASPVPGQVSALAVGTITYGSIALSWSIPVGGGTPTGFVVQYRVTGQSTWITQTVSVATTVITGLVAATEYDIQLLAYNAGGFGPASSMVNATTGAAPTVAPGAVTGLVASAPTANAVSLAWSPPTTGGTVGAYTAQYRVTGQSSWITFATGITADTVAVTGLTSSTEYDFQVFGVNSAGSGSPSPVVNGTTTIAAPGVPPPPVVGTATQTTLPLSWGIPITGGPVVTYVLQYRVTGSGAWTQITGVSGTAYTISGLASGTGYDVQVAASNTGGISAFSMTTTATTAVAPPGIPTGLVAGSPTSTTQSLAWIAPGSGGSAVSYTIAYSPHGMNSWTTITGVLTTAATISGLTPSTAYDYQVEAVNTGGTSGWTSAISATTSAPSSYLLTAGINPSANVSWAHGSGGNAINVNINTSVGDGSYTAPAVVEYGYSTSTTVAPTSWAPMTTGIWSTGGHNLETMYANAPAVAGVYYLWFQALSSAGAVVATYVSPYTVTAT